MIRELQEFGCVVDVSDYWADSDEVQHEYDIDLKEDIDTDNYDAVILAVAHDKYKKLSLNSNHEQILFDIKSVLDTDSVDGKL